MQRVLALLMVITAWSAALSAAADQQPSSEPVLRVETGMHTAAILQAAVDAAGHILATASQDKTLRLWSLATGDLLRTLRPPIGDANEGRLSGVAISPDGKTVAAGGWTCYQWEHSDCIYLFDVDSGRLVRRISGLPNVVYYIAWSPDGRYIAASLGEQNGIRVFRAANGEEVGRDTDFGERSTGLAFDRAGRLAAVGVDGYVRLYDADFHRTAKQKVPSGRRPYSVAFSPDGTRLAVGYVDITAVDVLSAVDLKPLFAADTKRLIDGDLAAVAWTETGALLAGGQYEDGQGRPVLRWSQGGKGVRETLAAAGNTLFSVVPLGDGGFAYASADPAFGRYDAHGKRTIDRRADIADYRGQFDKLFLSADATTVAFGLEVFGKRPMSFSVADRRLASGPAPGGLTAADTKGLAITDWFDNVTPKLAGKPLKLEQYEHSWSVAIAPDKRSFLLGAQMWLRRFDAGGTEVWKQAIPSVAWAVNLSPDGRLAVVALGDGTIRWYRYSDGAELLALFVHKDGKRWVLWTPQGYYDAAPGAEDLIGWHVNRGLDGEADFFPASRFRDRFYKPEVISAVLQTLDIDKALGQAQVKAAAPIAAAELPPIVKILSPKEGATVATSPLQLRYLVRTPSGERVTSVEVRRDGRPLPDDRGVVQLDNGPVGRDAEQEGMVAVPIDHDATITLVARAGDKQSEAANVRVAWAPPTPSPSASVEAPKPKLYVLAVGVSQYKDPDIQLQWAAKDAADAAAAWAKQQGGLYREVDTRVLQDQQATRDAILDGLDWIERETTQRDVAVVLMSGHGENDADGAYYYLPYDVDPERLRRTAVPDIEIRRSLAHIAGKALFFFDTCHSGSVMPGRRAPATDINGFVSELSSAENGLVVFAASTGREFAYEQPEWHNGAFSKALVEGLSGKADIGHQGVITINGLEFWLGERVKELTDGRQHPTTAKPNTISDFPVAVAR